MDWNNILDFIELSVVDEHDCNKNKDSEVAVLKCTFALTNEENWRVVKVWIAGDKEVADEEAEEIGEVIKLTTIPIAFCPFCGEKLEKE